MIQMVEASGTNYEIGFQIGQATKKRIKRQLDAMSYIRATNERIKKRYEKFLSIVNNTFPQYVDEIKGMADGADVPFNELMKLNLPELNLLERNDNCTTLILQKQNGFIVAHNEDSSTDIDVFLANVQLPSGLRALSVCYYGKLLGFSASHNSNGLFVVNDSLKCVDNQIGVPRVFVLRQLLECSTIQECVDVVRETKRATSQNYFFFKKNKAVNVESSATESVVTPIEKLFVHTNNFIVPKLIKYEGKPPSDGTFKRDRLARTLLKNAETKEDMIDILSSHENRPHCLCAHADEHGDQNNTLAVIIFDTIKSQLVIGHGQTCRAELQTFAL
jgi:predicted choloylglycine hydrolase